MERSSYPVIIAIFASLACLLSSQARANDRDLLGTTVPAASCVAVGTDNAPLGGVWLNGAFILRGRSSISGTAKEQLQCPLPINSVEISSSTSNDNDITDFVFFTVIAMASV